MNVYKQTFISLRWLLLVFISFASLFISLFLVTGHSLITYAKKLKILILSPLRIHNRAFPLSLPVHGMTEMIHCEKKIKYNSIFYLYSKEVRLIKKTGLDPASSPAHLFAIRVRRRLFFKNCCRDKVELDRYNICPQCIAHIIITPSRRKLVHISKRTTEPIVRCYCARLRRSCIVSLVNSCNEFKLRQNISIRRNGRCVCNVYTRASTRPSLPIQIRTPSSLRFQWSVLL